MKKKKATKEQKKFYLTEQSNMSKEWVEYHKKNAELQNTKEDIATAIVQFGKALKSLNEKREVLEKTTLNQPKDINTKFLNEYGESYYDYDFS